MIYLDNIGIGNVITANGEIREQQLEGALLPEHFHAPASHSSEESGPQVPGRVQWVSTVHTHGDTDGQDDQANCQGLHSLRSSYILAISYGQYAKHQHTCSNHLQQKSTLVV